MSLLFKYFSQQSMQIFELASLESNEFINHLLLIENSFRYTTRYDLMKSHVEINRLNRLDSQRDSHYGKVITEKTEEKHISINTNANETFFL